MTRTYEPIKAPRKSSKKRREKLMRDNKKHFLRMDDDNHGVLGYWEKGRMNQVFALTLEKTSSDIICHLERRDAKGKTPHDKLVPALGALGAAVVFLLVFRLGLGVPWLAAVLAAVVVGALLFGMLLLSYQGEYRSMYGLLDRYMKQEYHVAPKKGELSPRR